VTRRFYKEVAVTDAQDGGFGIALDNRPVRTPGGAPLALSTATLAEAVAAEWAAQDAEIRPLSMPMMRLAATAIDRVSAERAAIVDRIAAYGGSDLLCYRAEGPDALVALQAALWQPLLDWLAECHGARLTVTQGITHVAQDQDALDALRSAVAALDDGRLAAISQLTASSGSLVIALAVAARHIDAAAATAASLLDEQWQAEQWGEDAEAAGRRENLAQEIADAARFLDLLAN